MERLSVCLHAAIGVHSQKLLICWCRDFTIELEHWLNFNNLCEIVKYFFFLWIHIHCGARENSVWARCGLDINVQYMFWLFSHLKKVLDFTLWYCNNCISGQKKLINLLSPNANCSTTRMCIFITSYIFIKMKCCNRIPLSPRRLLYITMFIYKYIYVHTHSH